MNEWMDGWMGGWIGWEWADVGRGGGGYSLRLNGERGGAKGGWDGFCGIMNDSGGCQNEKYASLFFEIVTRVLSIIR